MTPSPASALFPKTIAMTLDDDSILSAYLDGQLGPEQQQAVESALFADPQLAKELRGLAFFTTSWPACPARPRLT